MGMSLFLNKVAGQKSCNPQPAALLKKGLWHRWFPVNFPKFFGTLFLGEVKVKCFQDMVQQSPQICRF